MRRPLMREVALRYRLPIFVLPCPDYAIRRAGAGSAVGDGDDDAMRWQRAMVDG